jgi:hypothetical protein
LSVVAVVVEPVDLDMTPLVAEAVAVVFEPALV